MCNLRPRHHFLTLIHAITHFLHHFFEIKPNSQNPKFTTYNMLNSISELYNPY